jgi:hypothetical protein
VLVQPAIAVTVTPDQLKELGSERVDPLGITQELQAQSRRFIERFGQVAGLAANDL